jgi:biopolymer transport protein ExbB/TolQ
MNIFATLSGFFTGGGLWMLPIAAAQIVSLAIIVERVITLYVVNGTSQRSLVKRFEDDIKRGNLERVMMTAQGMGNQPIASVIQAGTQAAIAMGGREEIQSKMDEVLLHENGKFEKRTGFLAMLGNVGTLLGLLGTIIGMTEAFGSVASANAAEKGAVLAKGISMAMNATAYGLIMAIPALVMYSILQNRANHLSEDLNQAALKIYNWLSFSYESIPQKSARNK